MQRASCSLKDRMTSQRVLIAGDLIFELNGQSLAGKRHDEVSKLIESNKELVLGLLLGGDGQHRNKKSNGQMLALRDKPEDEAPQNSNGQMLPLCDKSEDEASKRLGQSSFAPLTSRRSSGILQSSQDINGQMLALCDKPEDEAPKRLGQSSFAPLTSRRSSGILQSSQDMRPSDILRSSGDQILIDLSVEPLAHSGLRHNPNSPHIFARERSQI